ncbi:hypothetical protein [Salinicoccus sp. HZC-1]|uniref:hypothetical protein n=1 Tax=Salinicoccus sp. HZC-1 TaxID=3385497 RepID=UPI00398B9E19
MNFQAIKWLNFILTVVALFAVYIFLNEKLDPPFDTFLIVALIIVGLLSLVPVFRNTGKSNNGE